jgi:predicted aspartyl protease
MLLYVPQWRLPLELGRDEGMTHRFRLLAVAGLLAGASWPCFCAADTTADNASAAAATSAPEANTSTIATPAANALTANVPASPVQAIAPTGTSTPDSPEEGLSEVVVEAPEPVYVSPTLRDRIGRIWAPVRIDGKGPFRLVLDTGASHSAIVSRVAARIDDASVQTVNVMLHGVTGSAIVPALKVRSMEVGDMLIEPTTLPIVADAFGGAEGVLGREGLMDKRIFADFGGDKLTISGSHGQRAPQGFKVVPLKLTGAGLLATDVRIGSVRVRAIIDTGAQQSVGNMALLDALMRRVPRDSIDEQIIGVTLDLQTGKYVRVPPISMGSLKLNNVHVAFGDMALFEHWKYTTEPTLLVGMDLLGLFDKLIIDYKMREMQVRMRDRDRDAIEMHFDTNGSLFHGS